MLVETRPASGLLGGMLGLPGGRLERDARRRRAPPFAADWRDLGEVRHTFTHFHLILRLRGARLPARAAPPAGAWLPAGAARGRAAERHAQGAPPRARRPRLSIGRGPACREYSRRLASIV